MMHNRVLFAFSLSGIHAILCTLWIKLAIQFHNVSILNYILEKAFK